MRVALLSDCYLPRLGGIEVQVHDLAGHLAAAGHDVEVFTATHADTRAWTHEHEDGVLVHRLPLPVPGAPPVNPFARDEVRRRLAAGGFDVAHGHMGVVSPFATDLIGVALDVGLPTVVTWHSVVNRTAPLFRALGHARRWGRAGAALTAVSSMAAGCIARISDGVPVEVLGNGIDVTRWQPPAGRVRTAADEDGVVRVVGAIRFIRRKRPTAFVDVLRDVRARLDETVPGVRLEASLLGLGPQRRLVEAQLARHGIDWISLPGRVSRDELRELHWRSDIYLTTARSEAFGIAPLEARTAGLVVAAFAGTGVDDFITDGVDGILAESDTGLVDGITALAADPERLARMRAHNATTPPAQSWDRIVEATLDEYERARHLRAAAR